MTVTFTFPAGNRQYTRGPYPAAIAKKMVKAGNDLISHMESEHSRWLEGLGEKSLALTHKEMQDALLNWNKLSQHEKELAISGDESGKIRYSKKIRKNLKTILKGFDLYM